MTSTLIRTTRLLVAVGTLAIGTAHAALTVYTTVPTFTASATQVFTDTFNDLAIDFAASPLQRMNGPYAYAASAPAGLYGAGTTTDHWLSTNLSGATMTLGDFGGGVRALGGLFFGSDVAGLFLPGQSLTLRAVDSSGASLSYTLPSATEASFVGFVSDGLLVSVSVSIDAVGSWATANNLMLGQAVPEPESYALMLAGIAAVLGVARRRCGGREAG